MKNNKSILLVEDDQVDAMTVKRALKELNITNELFITGNGEEAVPERAGHLANPHHADVYDVKIIAVVF